MCRSVLIFCVILKVLTFSKVSSLEEEYCWREFTGSIPADAIIGGKDINGKNVYIGQAYLKNAGLIVVQIYPDVKEVYAPFNGIKKVDTYIKILCGLQQNFYWMAANSSDLHLTLIGKHAVIGGHEDDRGQIGIGRINHENEIKIGKINLFNPESAYFYFNDKRKERRLQSYEILMYQKNSFDIRIKGDDLK